MFPNVVHFSIICLPIWFRATRLSDLTGPSWNYPEIAHTVPQLDACLSSLKDRARKLKSITMTVAAESPSFEDIRKLYP